MTFDQSSRSAQAGAWSPDTEGHAEEIPKNAATTDKPAEGFTEDERAAIKERAKELKATKRRGGRAGEADDESALLAKIAEMAESDRVMAERLHAVITASAPDLSPKLW